MLEVLRSRVNEGDRQERHSLYYGEIVPCPATTLRSLPPSASALATISRRLAPKRTLKRRSSSFLQKRRPPCSPWNWVAAMGGFLSGFFPECAWRSESTRPRQIGRASCRERV